MHGKQSALAENEGRLPFPTPSREGLQNTQVHQRFPFSIRAAFAGDLGFRCKIAQETIPKVVDRHEFRFHECEQCFAASSRRASSEPATRWNVSAWDRMFSSAV